MVRDSYPRLITRFRFYHGHTESRSMNIDRAALEGLVLGHDLVLPVGIQLAVCSEVERITH